MQVRVFARSAGGLALAVAAVMAAATAAPASATSGGLAAASVTAASGNLHNSAVVFASGTGVLTTLEPTGVITSGGSKVAAGTRPSAVPAPDDHGWDVAYQSVNNEHLWSGATVADPHDTGLIMAAGTSPSSPSNAGNPAEADHLAFQGHNGHLTITTDADATTDTGLAMAAGTSPASVVLFSGQVLDVVQGANGHLWTFAAGTAGDSGLAMAAGTSPCAAVLTPSGELVIGFQAPTGELRVRHEFGTVDNSGLTMRAGTSPAVTIDGRGNYAFVSQSNDGHLATVIYLKGHQGGPAIYAWPLAAGTSPGVAAHADSKNSVFFPATAFQGSNGHLWTIEELSQTPVDTGLPMKPGTSPTVVPLVFG